ncbi:MAG: chorismate mutase [Kiritimatiellae bacterium]|nr:chorismate mutase [Kiritimatiellia bacterium]
MDLSALREEIDSIDSSLVPLIARRLALVDRIAAAKKESGARIEDCGREREILSRVASQAGEDCAPDVEAIFKAIFAVSKDRESRRMK